MGTRKIGTLHESSLHASLKQWYKQPGDELEVSLDNFVIDIVRGDLLIEIQTSNFSSIKKKLNDLLKRHKVRLVHPLASEKWIIRESLDGKTVFGKRRSPKRLFFSDVFVELVSIPEILINENFQLDLLLINEEEIRRRDWKGSWKRRGWSIVDRRLLEVVNNRLITEVQGYLGFLPETLEFPFTTTDMANEGGIPKSLARKIAYTLRKMKLIEQVGKKGNAILYS